MLNESFVSLERYKADMASFNAKNAFIKHNIEQFVSDYGFVICERYLGELQYLLDLVNLPADFFISDFDWKKAGK